MDDILQFYTIDIKPGEEVGRAWGQLVGAMHRITFVRDEMERVLKSRDFRRVIPMLEYHVENYLVRTYELRERAVALFALLCHDAALAKQLKSKSHRATALGRLAQRFAVIVPHLRKLLDVIDEDVRLRNEHTHGQFLSLGIWTGSDVYVCDPLDLVDDWAHDERHGLHLRRVLRDGCRELSLRYRDKASILVEATMALLRVVDPARRPGYT